MNFEKLEGGGRPPITSPESYQKYLSTPNKGTSEVYGISQVSTVMLITFVIVIKVVTTKKGQAEKPDIFRVERAQAPQVPVQQRCRRSV